MLLELILVIAAGIAYYYLKFWSRSNYWKKLGVRQPESNQFPYGNTVQTDYSVVLSMANLVWLTHISSSLAKHSNIPVSIFLPRAHCPASSTKDCIGSTSIGTSSNRTANRILI